LNGKVHFRGLPHRPRHEIAPRRRARATGPTCWIDATYVKVSQNGCIVSVAVTVAVGVTALAGVKFSAMDIGPFEAETFWTAFLRELACRGLRGVKPGIARSLAVHRAL
jgi:transposase-like protein